MTDKYFAVPQGKVYIATRNSTGLSSGYEYIGDTDGFTVNTTQQFLDIYESNTGNRAIVAHIPTQTDMTVDLSVLNIDGPNLTRAYNGDLVTTVAGNVVAESAKAYKGKTIPLKYASVSAVVVKKGVTVLALTTDYTVNADMGSITITSGTSVVTNGDTITVDYAHTGGTRIRGLTNTGSDYSLYFEGKSKFDNLAQKAYIHRVALDLAKQISLIGTGVNKLAIAGKVLPAAEQPTGESQYFTYFQE
jgi:hypothetical protein